MSILLFNLNTLEEGTLCDPEYLVEALRKFFKGQYLPKRSNEAYKPLVNLKKGSSFLLEPQKLFNSKVDTTYKAQYIRLAGRRDFLLYKTHNITYLDLSLYPDLDIGSIKVNPLLNITNKYITFKPESTYTNGN